MEHARGFSLNVSNFIETSRCLQYGADVLGILEKEGITGKSFVVDTGRNGAGPFRGQPEAWCNPPGRALGDPPREGPPPADALLWIKPPGDSDGTCRQGPTAGRFWPEYAIDLARATR
jgi:cellulase/cellobiase CelA1